MTASQDIHVSSKQNEGAADAVLILTDDMFNDLEFFYPYYRFNEAGYRVDVASAAGGEIKGQSGKGLRASLPVENLSPADYAMLYLPGGKAPATLRRNEKVLAFVRRFASTNRPIGVICHGAQILVSAGLAKGRRLAAWPEVAGEINEAGGIFVDVPLVEDGQFISARWPGDLPLHLQACLSRLNDILSTAPKRKRLA